MPRNAASLIFFVGRKIMKNADCILIIKNPYNHNSALEKMILAKYPNIKIEFSDATNIKKIEVSITHAHLPPPIHIGGSSLSQADHILLGAQDIADNFARTMSHSPLRT